MREVVPSEAFQDELNVVIRDARTADDYLYGVITLLADKPETGIPLFPGSLVWAIPMAPIAGEQVAIYYQFDSGRVSLLSIRPVRG